MPILALMSYMTVFVPIDCAGRLTPCPFVASYTERHKATNLCVIVDRN